MVYAAWEEAATHLSIKTIPQFLKILTMKSWVLNNKLLIAGVILGALGGYIYWQQIGCNSGTCTITSKWHNSTLYGALMGGLLFSIFKKDKNDSSK